jgi:hypothetical protein
MRARAARGLRRQQARRRAPRAGRERGPQRDRAHRVGLLRARQQLREDDAAPDARARTRGGGRGPGRHAHLGRAAGRRPVGARAAAGSGGHPALDRSRRRQLVRLRGGDPGGGAGHAGCWNARCRRWNRYAPRTIRRRRAAPPTACSTRASRWPRWPRRASTGAWRCARCSTISNRTDGQGTHDTQIAGHRRGRFHRRELLPLLARPPPRRDRLVAYDALTYAGNRANLRALEGADTGPFRARRHRDTALRRRAAARGGHRHDRALRRREPRRPFDRRSRRVHRHQRGRHAQPAEGRARGLAGRRGGRSPLPSRVDRRGLRLARGRCDPAFTETLAYAPNSPYSASKAASDSPGARLPSHLRPAGDDQQLLEQLRAVALPGEADPAVHREHPAGPQPADLRRRAQHPRLALRRRTTAAASSWCCRRGRSARPTTSAATTSGRTSTS